jgi:hypothetical protein
MMAWPFWSDIEGPLLAASLGVVSTPRAFDAAMLKQPIVIELLARLSSERRAAKEVARRLQLLLAEPTDPRYCHQHDLAIAIYLRALDICAPDDSLPPALLALKQTNLWWARAMAMRIATAPNRGIPSQREDAAVTINGQVVIFTATTQAQPFIPIPQLTFGPHLHGDFVFRTDAGFNVEEFSIASLWIELQSSLDVMQ